MKRALALGPALVPILILTSISATASAADPPRPPVRARGRAHVAPLLPTLELGVDTDGRTQVSVGLDLLLGITNGWDLAFSPFFRAKADSAANLFGGDADSGKWWLLGASLTFTQLGLRVPSRPGSGGPIDQLKAAAYQVCEAACTRPAASDDDRAFCDRFTSVSPSEIDPSEFCSDGKQLLRGQPQLYEWGGRFPRLALSVGAMAGSNSFQFLRPQLEESPSQKTPMCVIDYVAARERHTDWSFATSATFVGHNGMTVEVPLTVTERWKPSEHRVTACAAAGQYVPPGQAPTAPGTLPGTVPLQECQEHNLGSPVSTLTVFMTAQVGYVLRPSGFFRASVGPLLSWSDITVDKLTTVGFEAPVYLNFVSAPPQFVGDYKGLIRVTPAALWTHSFARWESRFVVLIELLGQRTLFGKALDWL
jgi:hypothetical protein